MLCLTGLSMDVFLTALFYLCQVRTGEFCSCRQAGAVERSAAITGQWLKKVN